MEYIDRDDLLKAAWDKPTLSLSVYDIGNIKPADVAPVRHGRWLRVYTDTEQFFLCNRCKKKEYLESDYCPSCGAKMVWR